MIMSVAVLSIMDGIKTEKEMDEWFQDKVMNHGEKLQFLIISGIGFLGLSAAFYALEMFK